MANSVAVFPAGYRLTDSQTGAPISGAKIYFYDAGTTSLKQIYSDQNLANEINNPVETDALGYPTSDGSTKTLVYVGTSSYKILIQDAGNATIAEHDNIKGAVDIVDLGSLSVSSVRLVAPQLSGALAYTGTNNVQNKILTTAPTNNSDVELTLPSASDAGNGWLVTIQHAGSYTSGVCGQVIISTSPDTQTISHGPTSFGNKFVLSHPNEEVTLVSNGQNWRATSYASGNIRRSQGLLSVTNRLSAPEGSEVQGDLYLITGAPTGAWASFAQNDIVQFTNGAWVRFSIPSNSGWLAYVQKENTYYRYVNGSWVPDFTNSQRVLTVVDRKVTPAGTELTGEIYLISDTPTGSWLSSSFSKNDLVLKNAAGNWVKFTPTANSGWLIYVQSEQTYYSFKSGSWYRDLNRETAKAFNWNGTTTNTTLDFTGIPSWVRRITIMIQGLSITTNDVVQVQLGYGSTPTWQNGSSDYKGSCRLTGSTANHTTAFLFADPDSTNDIYHGVMTLTNLTGNVWVEQSSASMSNNNVINDGSGSVSLSGALTAVRVMTQTGGTVYFDAGSVNIMYE